MGDELDQPPDHVVRSVPPWRVAALTECGLPLTEDRPVITREDLVRRVDRLGKQRAAFITCMTCWETVTRTASWESDPARAMAREFGRYGVRGSEDQMRREMKALMMLVEAHKEEFFDILGALDETSELWLARRKRARRT